METNATKPARSSRVILLTAGAIVAIIAVVYFSFFYPPVDTQDTQGTIGAAKKYRSEQITDQDVKLEGVQTSSSENAMADATDATTLKNTASYFAATAESFANRPNFDNKTVTGLQATANQLNALAQNIYANKPLGKDAVQEVLNAAAELKSKVEGVAAKPNANIGNTEVLAMQTSIGNLGEKVNFANKELANRELGNKEIGNKELGNKELGNKELNNKELGNKELGAKPLGNKELGNKPLGNKEIGNKPLGNKELGNKPLGNKEIGNKNNIDNKQSAGQ